MPLRFGLVSIESLISVWGKKKKNQISSIFGLNLSSAWFISGDIFLHLGGDLNGESSSFFR